MDKIKELLTDAIIHAEIAHEDVVLIRKLQEIEELLNKL